MVRVKIVSEDETTFRVSGTAEYERPHWESIQVKGNTYNRHWYESAVDDFDLLWANRKPTKLMFGGEAPGQYDGWHLFETSIFKPFGLPKYRLYYPSGFYLTGLLGIFSGSTNDYVILMDTLESTGVLSDIGRLAYGKFDFRDDNDEYHFLIDSYGWGNELRLLTPLHKLLKVPDLNDVLTKVHMPISKQRIRITNWLTRYGKELSYANRIVILSENINQMTEQGA